MHTVELQVEGIHVCLIVSSKGLDSWEIQNLMRQALPLEQGFSTLA